MDKLLPRWLDSRALFIGLVFGAYNWYNEAAIYGFSLEGNIWGLVRGLVGAVLLGAIITWSYPSRPKN